MFIYYQYINLYKMGLKEVSLTFGIAVLFALFVGFTIDAFYESPDYQDYCQDQFYDKPTPIYDPKIQANCTELDNAFMRNCTRENGMVQYGYDSQGCQIIKGCDLCQASFMDAEKQYNFNLLWMTAIIGIFAIIIGMYAPIEYDPVASGFIFGGVLTLMYGTMRVFGNLSKYARAAILAIELALVIWLGIKKVLNLPAKKKSNNRRR